MSAILWWGERLRAKQPLKTMKVDFNCRPPLAGGGWPRAVRRSSLYSDYCDWMASQKDVGLAKDHQFWAALSEYFYLGDRGAVKTYFVKEQMQHMGRWSTVKKRYNFIRLRPWEEHAEWFQTNTGIHVGFPVPVEKYIPT